jgi:hypothetical protein
MIERGQRGMGHLINAIRGSSNVREIRVGKALFPVDVRILGGPGS